MEAHAEDLHSVTKNDRLVEQIKTNFHSADIDSKTKALLKYCIKITVEPSEIQRDDVDGLRRLDATDEEILETVQVAAYFNYINRVCDALGCDLEDFMKPEETSR